MDEAMRRAFPAMLMSITSFVCEGTKLQNLDQKTSPMVGAESFESRDLLQAQPNDRHHAGPRLTLAQVGLGQSRGYLFVRELPDGSSVRRWCVLKDDLLWFFDEPDSCEAGTSLPLENAVCLRAQEPIT